MKRKSSGDSKFPHTTDAPKRRATRRHGRRAALILTALAAAAIVVTTASLAQVREKTYTSQRAQSPAHASSIPAPRKRAAELPSTEKEERRRSTRYAQQEQDGDLGQPQLRRERTRAEGRPREWRLRRARTFRGDLRSLPQTRPLRAERPELEGPEPSPGIYVPPGQDAPANTEEPAAPVTPEANAPAPPPSGDFDGLDFQNNGAGHPPDTVGDVGPNHYIQSINSSVGIFDKATGARIAAFTLNTFMSQGAFGNLCDTNNFGDPVVLYDTFDDRWVITDFAFRLDSGGNVINPPGAFQCIAVSRTGDPVSGGWNFYSINTAGGLGDYPKLGVWPDGIYMSVNMFGYPNGAPFQGARAYAFNKAQMYAGAPTVQVVSFDIPGADFAVLPSNARLQTGTPPPGTPNYFLSTWQFLNALNVYKFHVDWEHLSLSTFTGPDVPLSPTSWPNQSVANAPSQGGNNLDVLQIRAMMQNQYTNIGGAESLWTIHTVRRALNGTAAPRFYQVPVTGGVVGANVTQAATFDPDGANVMHRFMPSLAVDRMGDMMFGYNTSSGTTKPAIKYAGRLATDPLNTFSQTEQVLIQGAGTQAGNCGGAPCTRWGDYSAMSLDPDGCTFWYTNMYYKVDGLNHQTHIGKFKLSQCTVVGSGGIQGNVTSGAGGAPIGGATVALGSRTTTTDASGFYSFTNIPAGTYPSITASFPGYTSSGANSLVVNESSVTVQNFTLNPGANAACPTDTTLTDFQAGTPTNLDLTTSPGDISLFKPSLDQQNTNISGSGVGINTAVWGGQTFTPAVTSKLTKADINLFCFGCTGTTPSLTLSVRATSGGLPTGPDLASATIPGFASGTATYYTATFAAPPTLTAGTQYALVIRPVANPSAAGSTYALTRSASDVYAGGARVSSGNAGGTWATPLTGASTTDTGFRIYMDSGYAPAGSLTSGLKDANPHAGGSVSWTTLSWNASTPAGTSVKFQVAASNSASGPFSFVGPDGTAATFFTASGASLAQFNGKRYLKYQAILSTTNSAATPTLNDVSVCFNNTAPTALSVGSATGTYGGAVNLSATLTDGVSPLAGKTVAFTLNGNSVGNAVTDASGVASLPNASLGGINAGSYPTGVGASFAGDANYVASSAGNSLTVNRASTSVLWSNPADIVYGTALGAAQLNATAGVPGSFVYTPPAGTVLNAGNGQTLHVDFTPTDTVNYTGSSADVSVNVLKAPLTVKADDKSRPLGAANPPFTATFTGFVLGEGPDVLGGTLTFTTTATPASPVGNYPIVPGGLTSSNYQMTLVNGTLAVGYNVCLDFDNAKAKQSGSTIPVKLHLCDASGANRSNASVVVHAAYVVNAATNAPQTLEDAGNANPDGNFRFDSGGYIFNLKTTGYTPGNYLLGFNVAGDPTPHAVQFSVK